ncbi:MAG: hypothetical protein K1X66_08170 [Verrucomicrobiae bacterium]|nr:hypothetical protein [Verrucomicrobiae bacterium]
MKKILFLCFLLNISHFGSAQNFVNAGLTNVAENGDWVQAVVMAVATDNNNNCFVTGVYGSGDFSAKSTLDFEPSPLKKVELQGLGDQMFIAKYSPSGALIWIKQIPAFEDCLPRSIAVDPKTQDIVIIGQFIFKIDFDPGPGEFFLNNEEESKQTFVLKLNNQGNFVWAKQLRGNTKATEEGGVDYSRPFDLVINSNGNIFITGEFSNSVDFDPSDKEFFLETKLFEGSNVFVWALNASGNFLWAKEWGWQGGGSTNSGVERGTAVAVDNIGHLYVGGTFGKTIFFEINNGVLALPSAGESDSFVLKLDASNGKEIWAKRIGGPANDLINSIEVNRAQQVIIAGNFSQTCDFNPGPAFFPLTSAGDVDGFVATLDHNGELVWAKKIGGAKFDQIDAMALDRKQITEPFSPEDIVITGTFTENVDFDLGPGEFFMKGLSESTIFYEKMNSSGNLIWAQKLNGGGAIIPQLGRGTRAEGVAIDNLGDVILGGGYDVSADLDPGPGLALFTTPGVAKVHYFCAKYNGDNGLLRAITPQFNEDIKTDIIFQNTLTGTNEVWLMNGHLKLQSSQIQKENFSPSPEWRIAAVGDFNRDVKSDLIMENTLTGQRQIWLMNRFAPGQIKSTVSLPGVGTQWRIAATGEFNNDGCTDIVWENKETGDRAVWLLYNTSVFSGAFIATVPTDWKIVGTGFFDDNERTDLLWQNSRTKERVIWTMDGTIIQSFFSFGKSGNWEFVGSGFFNNDDRSDIILENKGTSQRVIWLLDDANNFIAQKNAIVLPNFSADWEVRNR